LFHNGLARLEFGQHYALLQFTEMLLARPRRKGCDVQPSGKRPLLTGFNFV
jgi:hypothetical protein